MDCVVWIFYLRTQSYNLTKVFILLKLGQNKGRICKSFNLRRYTGKIQAGEAGLSPLRKQLEKELGMEVDLSVIKAGGKFDNGSQLPMNK